MVDPDYCEGCGIYDARCWTPDDPYGGLGCNACNRPKCRFCKSDEETSHWIKCSTIPPISKTTQATTTETFPATTSTTSSTTSPSSEKIVLEADIEFTGSFDWSDDLSDKTSDGYQALAIEIENFISALFEEFLNANGLSFGTDMIPGY